ncbi:winged helix-turn-helix domain-containing protein [Mangrovicoccus ximenensis]|uniref:winged helix-turn-helix domain-containing protein n=1 Tax=Mangrovicoccus ximenensis TaxID=1911570 RepID=UPI001F017528|nr:winged helix-turn-helix domain-containing protein [Mangrovicoccus ximenensis]
MHIFGPAGSGTSTLGRALAGALASQHFDTDDFYWLPTDPPFTRKRPVDERLALMEAVFLPRRDWVLSGSVESWGMPIAPRVTMAIHLSLEPELRRSRLERREALRCNCGLVLGPLRYSPATLGAELDGQRLQLTRREAVLLGALMRHPGQVQSKERLYGQLFSFDDADVGLNAIELYVARLRKRLAGSPVAITTQRGLGYRIGLDG